MRYVLNNAGSDPVACASSATDLDVSSVPRAVNRFRPTAVSSAAYLVDCQTIRHLK